MVIEQLAIGRERRIGSGQVTPEKPGLEGCPPRPMVPEFLSQQFNRAHGSINTTTEPPRSRQVALSRIRDSTHREILRNGLRA